MLLLLKSLPSNAAKNLLVKNGEHNLEQAVFDGLRGDVQLRLSILLSVPIFQQVLRLTSFCFSSFLE